jgi:hypothetical protein
VAQLFRPPKLAGVHGDRWTVRSGIPIAGPLRDTNQITIPACTADIVPDQHILAVGALLTLAF